MAQFFGLLSTQASESEGVSNIVDGDTDYCTDTYYYWNDNSSVLKNTSKEEDSVDENTEYFTSYNVMDRYSWKKFDYGGSSSQNSGTYRKVSFPVDV